MNRESARRLSRAEKLLPGALERYRKTQEQFRQLLCGLARTHAIAVAAISLFGEPKSDEPLRCAWERSLAYDNSSSSRWLLVKGASHSWHEYEEAIRDMRRRELTAWFNMNSSPVGLRHDP
jgi:hypothetical protein